MKTMPWGDLPRVPRIARGEEPSMMIVVDKPEGVTSHDVVGAFRCLLGTRKIGHAGTLDPMATGVLILGVGKMTRLLQYVSDCPKEYTATVRFGISTDSDDRTGNITHQHGCASLFDEAGIRHDIPFRHSLSEEEQRRVLDVIKKCVARLTGSIEQVPSDVSAIKVNGKRAYDIVRDGEGVDLPSRRIDIYSFELCSMPRLVYANGLYVIDIDIRVECSKGTYIRALARDLGAFLQTGAHLTQLRRTSIGQWNISKACSVDQARDCVTREDVLPHHTFDDVLPLLFSVIHIDDSHSHAVMHGQFISLDASEEEYVEKNLYALRDSSEYVALAIYEDKVMKPRLVWKTNKNTGETAL